MKRILLSIFLILTVTSCTASPLQSPRPQTSPQPPTTQADVVEAGVTETQVPTPSALVHQNTPLPVQATAPIVPSPSIIFIEMMDEIFGWGITETEILTTNDGGMTWYDVTPPGLTDVGYSVYTEFLDPFHAWAQIVDPNNFPNGGTLYRTTDGGMTWETFKTPFSDGDIEFVDASNGWMMASLGVGAGSMAISVFQTTDGGATWKRAYTNDPNLAGAGESLPLGGIKVMLAPLNMNTAWVGGVVYSSGSTYLFRTDDRGKTWSQTTMILPAEAQTSELTVEQVKFFSPTQGFLALRMTSANLETILFTTEDGGVTWNPAPERLPGAGKLEVPSAHEAIFYNNDQFYVTNDAANTFTVVNPNIHFADSITDMSFINSLTGWVITTTGPTDQRTLYKTTDGGATWLQITQ